MANEYALDDGHWRWFADSMGLIERSPRRFDSSKMAAIIEGLAVNLSSARWQFSLERLLLIRLASRVETNLIEN